MTATENALTAAVAARGTTVLRNAASEPHVQDLAHFLVAMGAAIEGIGTNKLTIHGGRSLGSATHRIGPDHIEVGSFIGLAAVTSSELRIADAGDRASALHAHGFRAPRRRRARSTATTSSCRRTSRNPIQIDLGGHVPKLEDQPWPAFPADTMSIAIVTATQCKGLILIHEKMFESRLFFVDKLIGHGRAHRAVRSASRARGGAVAPARRNPSNRPTFAPAWRC